MRLSLAITIVAANSVPTSSSIEDETDWKVSKSKVGNFQTKDGRYLFAASSMDIDGGRRMMMEETIVNVGGIKNKKNRQQFGSLFRERSMRTLQQKLVDEEDVQGCDPSADVGILSCGEGRYCMESALHNVGGVCVGHSNSKSAVHASSMNTERRRHLTRSRTFRQLQAGTTVLDSIGELCNVSTGVTCETCTIDVDAYKAQVNCTYDESCYMLGGYCSDDEMVEFCGTANILATVTAPGVYNYTLSHGMTNPDNFLYRVTFNSTDEDGTENQPTCEVEVNGVVCNSCTPLLDATTGAFCPQFDCKNTMMEASTHSCDFSIAEAWAGGWLYSQLPCDDGCNLCGDGGRMGNPMGEFTIPNIASLKCFNTQFSALAGAYNDQQCLDLQGLVEEPCECDVSPSSTSLPPETSSESGSKPTSTTWTSAAVLTAAGANLIVALA